LIFIVAAIASFVTTFLVVPWLIRNLKNTSAVGRDFNKPGAPRIPEMGGLAVVIGFYVGVNVLTIWGENNLSSSIFYLSLLAVLGAAVTGIMDDLFSLRQRVKAFLPFIFAIPLGSLMVDTSNTVLLGIDFGILMLFIAPFGITSAANAANMLEGFNGLGAGMGIIITSSMIVLSLILGRTEGLFLLLPLLGALIAFLWFNKYPAKIFPGDSMTLFVGATIACAAIISNLKSFGAILFIPMIVEFFLKLRGHFKGENYGTLNGEGNLSYEGKIESLAHLVMRRRKVNEKQIVYIFWAVEILVAVVVVGYAMLTQL
jgi:UDP-N-acetylglucosamine--dolichyl-phosphate N-acetylglucosaminephosphotransferase